MIIETIIIVAGISSVVSYETTGKGIADHAISAVANQDCKIARAIHDEQVCQSEPQGSVTVSVPVSSSYDTITRANDVFAARARRANENH
jgi:hypothetical protein